MNVTQLQLPGTEPPRAGLAADQEAILRKRTCRIDEAARVIGCSENQVRNFIATLQLAARAKSLHLDPPPARKHVVVVVNREPGITGQCLTDFLTERNARAAE